MVLGVLACVLDASAGPHREPWWQTALAAAVVLASTGVGLLAAVRRQVLGIAQWNVFGVSYGSDLALALMRDHREGIRSVVLDSTVPPNRVSLPGWRNARDGVEALFRACASQPRCRTRYPRLKQTFTRLVRRFESRPARITVRNPRGRERTKVMLDGGALVN